MTADEYDPDDFITSYYPKRPHTRPVDTYQPTGLGIPATDPEYQHRYWSEVKKPRLAARAGDQTSPQ